MGKRIDLAATEAGVKVRDENGLVIVEFWDHPHRRWTTMEMSAYTAQLVADAIQEARSDALGSGLVPRAHIRERILKAVRDTGGKP